MTSATKRLTSHVQQQDTQTQTRTIFITALLNYVILAYTSDTRSKNLYKKPAPMHVTKTAWFDWSTVSENFCYKKNVYRIELRSIRCKFLVSFLYEFLERVSHPIRKLCEKLVHASCVKVHSTSCAEYRCTYTRK